MANHSFPDIIDIINLRQAIDGAFDQIVIDYGEILEQLSIPLLRFIQMVDDGLNALPWYVLLFGIMGLTYHASRSWKLMLFTGTLMFSCGVIGLWEVTVTTIALMLISTLLAILIGLPIGTAMAKINWLERMMLPILDIMQTLPIFVYLIPFVMLLGPGQVPAILATLVFALPPVVRLTNLGIRQVDKDVLEAAAAFGANNWKKLITVQIPLALPTIMAGINQTIMMALSMVVIASMIGAGGLGYQVLQGIQRLEISRGLLAGLAIVFLAVIFDRIAQSYAKRTPAMRYTNLDQS